jgi:hypothetical protein
MIMDRKQILSIRLGCIAAVLLLAGQGQAQVTVSSNPLNGASGVSLTAPVVFSFSGPVDTNATAATFYSLSPPGGYPTSLDWNSSSNQLTCTPFPAFPVNRSISWIVSGQDADGNQVLAQGTFTTGTGSGGSGTGTNVITTFAVGKIHYWDQTSAGAPVPDPTVPYFFSGSSTLASNRTATSITLTLPTAAVSNLTQNTLGGHPESYFLNSFMTSSNAFEATFPQGTYTFFVSATASNQSVQVLLPPGMTQPNPPHITNFVAAQSVNATQAFTLGWEAFVGGTSTDYVNVVIGNNVWKTPEPGTAGALNGTATSVTIPANSLQANSNYTATIGFYHYVGVSNANYMTQASRATGTEFNLSTAGGNAQPVVTNAVWSGGSFSFDIITTPQQALTVVSSTNCALPLAQWPTLLTTNSPGTNVHITDPRPATNRAMVYRVRNGT